MITQEIKEIRGAQYVYTRSDTYMIMQKETGREYVDALDSYPCRYTYIETEILLPKEPEDIEPDDATE